VREPLVTTRWHPGTVISTDMIPNYYCGSLKTRDKFLAFCDDADSAVCMIQSGFLSEEDRKALTALARDASSPCWVTRRANALVLLDAGWSCQQVATAFLLDEDDLKAWIDAALPRSTRQIGAWIEIEFGLVYESRSGLVALLHRLGPEYHKPDIIPRKPDVEKQKAFIESYDNLLNSLPDNEAVLFVDAVHPTHAARAAGCWTAKDARPAIEQTTGRQRLNIHGAIDLETGQTRMIEAETIDAASTIKLLAGLEALYATTAPIHVFLDHARYHHAKIVQEWLSQPGRRIVLHFVPSYCPHLNAIERLWALMHEHLTHNKTYPTCREFADAIFAFLRDEVPRRWGEFCDSVTENFRVILPAKFRILA